MTINFSFTLACYAQNVLYSLCGGNLTVSHVNLFDAPNFCVSSPPNWCSASGPPHIFFAVLRESYCSIILLIFTVRPLAYSDWYFYYYNRTSLIVL